MLFRSPPAGCSDKGCADIAMKAYAAEKHSDVAKLGRAESCPVSLEMYGHDFAVPDWPAADHVVDYFAKHPELNVSLKYSTPTLFYEEMNKCTVDWEVFQPPNNDFFPYWTGFFSSQQVFKRMVRSASAVFQVSRIVHALNGGTVAQAKALNVLWQAVGVTQHHDGVTGTSPPATCEDLDIAGSRHRSSSGTRISNSLLVPHRHCLVDVRNRALPTIRPSTLERTDWLNRSRSLRSASLPRRCRLPDTAELWDRPRQERHHRAPRRPCPLHRAPSLRQQRQYPL